MRPRWGGGELCAPGGVGGASGRSRLSDTGGARGCPPNAPGAGWSMPTSLGHVIQGAPGLERAVIGHVRTCFGILETPRWSPHRWQLSSWPVVTLVLATWSSLVHPRLPWSAGFPPLGRAWPPAPSPAPPEPHPRLRGSPPRLRNPLLPPFVVTSIAFVTGVTALLQGGLGCLCARGWGRTRLRARL